MAWYNYEDAILLTEEEFQEGCCNCSAHCAEGAISVPCDGDRGECPFYGELESDSYDKKIRAKAIEEFAERIRDWQKEIYQNGKYAGELDFLFKHINEIAEEMKGE